ncbi:MAG: threonine ammonia-lyase [Bacteroidales bacterium]|nr:threonine ammonia-lyase [Bacteroidales bacterium]
MKEDMVLKKEDVDFCDKPLPTLADIMNAKKVLEQVVKKTDLERSKSFSSMSGANVFLKSENLQSTGSFKVRGAFYRISKLNASNCGGILCASAGNHAQGVAFAATNLGVKSTVFMPEFAPPLKVAATKSYGAEVILKGSSFNDAYEAAMEFYQSNNSTFIHPYNHPDIIAGAGTIGVEIFEQLNNIDMIFVPIGGGGLISGIAIAIKNLNPNIKVIGVEAEGAHSMRVSMDNGKLTPFVSGNTIADGIAVKAPGNLNFEAVQKYVDDIVVVNDNEIARTTYMLLQRAKTLAEPSGAASLAAILSGKINVENKNVVSVISGGNINTSILEQIIEQGVMAEGYRARIAVIVPDQTGKLMSIISILDKLRASIHEINHERSITSVPVGHVLVTITFNLQDISQLKVLTNELSNKGLSYRILS